MCQIQYKYILVYSRVHCIANVNLYKTILTNYLINFFQMATRLLLVTATMNLPSGENATLSSMVSPSTREPSSILGQGTMPKSGWGHGISKTKLRHLPRGDMHTGPVKMSADIKREPEKDPWECVP